MGRLLLFKSHRKVDMKKDCEYREIEESQGKSPAVSSGKSVVVNVGACFIQTHLHSSLLLCIRSHPCPISKGQHLRFIYKVY